MKGKNIVEAKRGPSRTENKPVEEQNSQNERAPPKIPESYFPNLPPFPKEGILGMYPINSACKREVAEHMAKFQRKLQEEVLEVEPDVTSKIIDFRNPNPLAEALDKVSDEMGKLETEVNELKHRMAVEAIKKKYQDHDSSCPCYERTV